jgi:hypothetical protein
MVRQDAGIVTGRTRIGLTELTIGGPGPYM